MNLEDKNIYDKRWKNSAGTSDEDILSLSNPKTQVSFFYYEYNKFILNQLSIHLDNLSQRKLLEIGCGRGTSSIYQALKTGIEVVPTDYSEDAIKIAQKNLDKYDVPAKAVHADMFNLPFAEEYFDAIISLGVMEHIEDAQLAYKEMHQKLKKGGIMISMNVPEKPTNIQRIAVPINKLLTSIRNILYTNDSKPWLDSLSRSKTADVYRSERMATDFIEYASSAGFESVHAYEINPFPTIDPVPKLADNFIVKIYELTLFVRKLLGMKNPFISNLKNSRTHFIVAIK